jgi:hypothetical protein
MTAAPTLEAFLRWTSRKAEGVFKSCGEIAPVVHVQEADGKEYLIAIPVAHDGPAARDALDAMLRAYFADHNVARYALVVECWHGAPGLDGSISSHPDRRECVSISVEDRDRQLYAMRDIIRPAGCKPYLGKLEILTVEYSAQTANRFIRLPAPTTRQ